MDNDALDPTGVLREALFEGCLAGRLGLASREAQLLIAALGANGHVVVPGDLIDRLATEARGVKEHGHDPKWLVAAAAAVVEAVGPTREDH